MPEGSQTRARRDDSLPSVIAGILDDFEIPVPSDVVRVLAGERRGQEVKSEQLSRIIAYEKESFLRTRMPPLVCSGIDRRGLAVKPRIWARGNWRLARRIQTPDVQDHWQAKLAIELCREVGLRFPESSQRPRELALEAVARSIGPVATYMPGTPDEWLSLSGQVRQKRPDPDPTGFSPQQQEAESQLQDPNLKVAAVNLYFGHEVSVLAPPAPSTPASLRLPVENEPGRPFDEIVLRRFGGDGTRTRALLAYIQGWSHIRDEWGRPPSGSEFADYWNFDLASVRTDEELFAQAFPEEESPERIVQLLDEALPRSGLLASVMGLALVDMTDTPPLRQPAPGQRWKGPDETVLTISEVDGENIIGHLSRHGTMSIWVGTLERLEKEFHLDFPGNLWDVVFELDVSPPDLLAILNRGDVALTNLRHPADPRPGEAHLRAATVRAQVVAEGEDEARAKVVEALRGHAQIEGSAIRVQALR